VEKESILNIPDHNLTPGMKQYKEAKQLNPDCVIMLRMGDFYELFYEDAIIASKELDITLTQRGKNEKAAPLAGVPYHALEPYLGKLVKKGYKVAIVEQLEDPKLAKGLVKRGTIRIVTPGTLVDSSMLTENENNYLMSLTIKGDEFAAAFCDLSTGEFFTSSFTSEQNLMNDLIRFQPAECIIPESLKVNIELCEKIQAQNCFVNTIEDYYFKPEKAKAVLLGHFNRGFESFGLNEHPLNLAVSGGLMQYLIATQKNALSHLKKISLHSNHHHMIIDSSTFRNLELTKNIRDGTSKGSLLSVMDKTVTSLGARLLRKWIKTPLLNKESIEKRLDAVELLRKNIIQREEIVSLLKDVYDLERLISRVNYGNASPKDLLALKQSLQQIPLLKRKLKCDSLLLQSIGEMSSLEIITTLIEKSLKETAPLTIREGGMIKSDFNEELSKLHDIKKNGTKYLQQIELREIEKTGISSLKIRYNRVFGYFIEITKKHLHAVPEHYIRKQTTANSERYITEELKVEEEKILGADDKIKALEYDLFQRVVKEIAVETEEIQKTAVKIAVLDVLCSFAKVAAEQNYVKPEIVSQNLIHIWKGRHPVVEKMVDRFVTNDIILNENEMMIITGPNMAGKCVTGDTIVYTDKGMIPIENFKPKKIKQEEFLPFKLNLSSLKGKEQTSHFYYDGKRSTIKLKTRFGYEIEGTPNHPIFVRTKEGQEIWRKLGDIQKDDFIIIKRNINLWGKKKAIPKKILNEILTYKFHHNVKKHNLPQIIDEDLAYLIGLLIGDGTLTYRNDIYLSNIDLDIINEFKRISLEQFGIVVKTKKNEKDHSFTSRQIRFFFEKIGVGYNNALKKEIPCSIMQAPKIIVKSFLQGLYDTDGFVSKRYGNASLSTSSLKLAKQVQIILLNFGIISSLKLKKTKRNDNYRVQVYGENAILFHQLIGLRVHRKSIRKDLASNVRMPNDGIPHLKYILKEIQTRIVEKKDKITSLKKMKNINSIFYTYIPNNRNISYHKLKELVEYCNNNDVKCGELNHFLKNNYFYDSIANVQKSSKKKDVYDFTVPKTHSFIANGFVNHNSTVMRQTALIVLMAQMGSFVPAEECVIGISDRIFTRVGAYDDLASGQSTFMVEMTETASILHNATERSLIILDEIGRGTSTFDGVSIAWSVAEHIYNKIKAKTLFATHYHVMNKLAGKFDKIKNYNIAVKEKEGDIIFLRKLIEGGTDQSYGVHVAKLAGLPFEVLERAREIQEVLEKDDDMVNKIKVKKLQEQKSLDGWGK